jgi:steroid 5-alpha reductase family enzyme
VEIKGKNKMENKNRSLIGVLVALVIAAGLAAAGSQGGVLAFGLPLFALCVGLAFLIQWLAFIPAFMMKTEKFYDLTGSITYLSVLVAALILSPAVDARGWLLTGLISVWSLRLGTFLFTRIKAAGEDRRFREIKKSFARFLLAWTLQGLWVAFSLSAALAAITSQAKVEFDVFALVGLLVWLLGFGIEVAADRQKSKFKADPANRDRFINVGLWAWSRHPNYFGEIVLWVGITIIALPVLSGWQWLTLISPVFVFVLLTRISGVPMLEARADEKWGGQPDYEEYKAKTPILILRPPMK